MIMIMIRMQGKGDAYHFVLNYLYSSKQPPLVYSFQMFQVMWLILH